MIYHERGLWVGQINQVRGPLSMGIRCYFMIDEPYFASVQGLSEYYWAHLNVVSGSCLFQVIQRRRSIELWIICAPWIYITYRNDLISHLLHSHTLSFHCTGSTSTEVADGDDEEDEEEIRKALEQNNKVQAAKMRGQHASSSPTTRSGSGRKRPLSRNSPDPPLPHPGKCVIHIHGKGKCTQ